MKQTKSYKLSLLAESDLENIFDYTFYQWGESQAAKYQLYSRFEWLADSPALGTKRDEIKKGYKSFHQGKHTIFYREINEGIEIIGIPHQNEDTI